MVSARMLKACQGYTRSQGGLNLAEFKRALKRKYPGRKEKIDKSSRQKLNEMCKPKRKVKSTRKYTKMRTISGVKSRSRSRPKSGSRSKSRTRSRSRSLTRSKSRPRSKGSLTSRYCRCVAKVTAKNPKKCYSKGKFTSGPGCYNPYAICTSSVGRTGKVKCGKYYSSGALTKGQTAALARSKGVSSTRFKQILRSEK
ncbi:hypothetical protein OAG24_01035 [bacterium]|nr:hypothetical protein [bacterium]